MAMMFYGWDSGSTDTVADVSAETQSPPEKAKVTATAEEPLQTETATTSTEADSSEAAAIDPAVTSPPADTPTPEAVPKVVADSNADFSETLTHWDYFWGKPGANEWEAMQVYKANHYGKPCWHTYPNHVRICNDFGNPGNNDDIVWRWRSTVSGPLEVQVQARKLSGSGDGVVISVYQGSTAKDAVMQKRTQDGAINETLTLENVAKDEFIFFVMNKNGSETLDDTEFVAKICHYSCP